MVVQFLLKHNKMLNQEQNILKLSLSKTKTYIDCNKKYNFVYNLKLPRKEMDYHIFGKFLHKVLEDFHQYYINKGTEAFNIVMGVNWKNALIEYKSKMSKDAIADARNIIDQYLKLIYKDSSIINKILSVEKNFNLQISEHVSLNGMIDRIQRDDDGIIHVGDYKSTKDKKYLKDFFQLLTYAYVLCVEDPTIEIVRGSYILLRHNFEYLTETFTKEQILETKEKYLGYAKQIEEEQLWKANPTFLCKFCEFINLCPEGNNLINPKKIHGAIEW
jgi:RecB family exonuclease